MTTHQSIGRAGILSAARASHAGLGIVLVAGLLLCAGASAAADRWEEAGSGAVAILPEPQHAKGILGGSLHCAEQRWRIFFRLEADAVAPGWRGGARLTVGEIVQDGEAEEAGGSLAFALPADMLDPLRAGARMSFASEDEALAATFSLIGSRATIDAVQPRCSQVDMSAYSPVTLSDTSPDLEAAKTLLAAEAKLFRAAAGKQPAYAAARLDLAEGRRLLFASLCGSTVYYGKSGCSLFGFAAGGGSGEWRRVYNTEGLLLHTDPLASKDGWPNLATLPLAGGVAADHWAWNGEAYELLGTGEGGLPLHAEGDAEE